MLYSESCRRPPESRALLFRMMSLVRTTVIASIVDWAERFAQMGRTICCSNWTRM